MSKLRIGIAMCLAAGGVYLLAGARNAETALPPSPFPEADIVSDAQLADLRGGFSISTLPGISFNFGISVMTSFDAPDLPGMPTLNIETNLYFEDNGDSPNVPTVGYVTSTTTSTTASGSEVLNDSEHQNVDFSQMTFTTENTIKVIGDNLIIDSNAGFGDLEEVPDAGLAEETPNLVLLNSFNNELIANVISNTLSGVSITQVTTVNIDLTGHATLKEMLPSSGVSNLLQSIDNSVLRGISN
ncbi:MAG: hypothetical protein WDZ84_04225 [Rhodovibrionaceae bacterium]